MVASEPWLPGLAKTYVPTGALDETSDHATMVATIMAGNDTEGYYYRIGIASSAYLISGAIATSNGEGGAFDTSLSTFYNAYNYCFSSNWDCSASNENGDVTRWTTPTSVINSSWGYDDDPTGRDVKTMALDGMARAYSLTTLVLAAGNSTDATSTSNNVGGPASGFNSISVGSIGDGTEAGLYKISDFSSRGPQDFAMPDGTVLKGVRAPVDIVAPGGAVMVDYDATTGNIWYGDGTSFAAPVVSGGVALLKGYSIMHGMVPTSFDSRVIKAVLMNSATKLEGWTNGQVVNELGVTVTTQALDWVLGAGMLDLNKAYDQYISGTQDVEGVGGGVIAKLGWDYGEIEIHQHNDYRINLTLEATAVLDVTLSWFRNLGLPVLTDNADATLQTLTTEDIGFANIYLEIWDADFTHLFARSMADYNTVQELRYSLPRDGDYALRVIYDKQLYGVPDLEGYGLAWYVESVEEVPEPGAVALVGLGVVIAWGWVRFSRHGSGQGGLAWKS